jgi:RND superfamily putative drug exporter
MDYEVFLLSRICEERRAGATTVAAVATALQRTGGVVTAAALLISVSLVSLATSGIVVLKLLGLTLALAIVVDATVVRCLLVPALMRLMGEANWWLPGPLRRLRRVVELRDLDAETSHHDS